VEGVKAIVIHHNERRQRVVVDKKTARCQRRNKFDDGAI